MRLTAERVVVSSRVAQPGPQVTTVPWAAPVPVSEKAVWALGNSVEEPIQEERQRLVVERRVQSLAASSRIGWMPATRETAAVSAS